MPICTRRQLRRFLAGQFAINPYTENGRSIAPYVQQHKAITGFEANYHLGQARFLEKLDLADGKRLIGEKLKQALVWKNKRGVESMNPIPFLTEEEIQKTARSWSKFE